MPYKLRENPEDYEFDIEWIDSDNEYVATCDELPGLSAIGPTKEIALEEAHVAAELYIEELKEATHLL